MTKRRATLVCLLALLVSLVPAVAAQAAVPSHDLIVARGAKVLAQEEGEGSTEETGPPWTFQMARISIVLLVFLFAGIGWIYYKLVVRRRRGEA
jgi:hypothetical protein